MLSRRWLYPRVTPTPPKTSSAASSDMVEAESYCRTVVVSESSTSQCRWRSWLDIATPFSRPTPQSASTLSLLLSVLSPANQRSSCNFDSALPSSSALGGVRRIGYLSAVLRWTVILQTCSITTARRLRGSKATDSYYTTVRTPVVGALRGNRSSPYQPMGRSATLK